MKQILYNKAGRVLLSLMVVTLVIASSFAGTAPAVMVCDAGELTAALNDAAVSGDATTIYYAAGTLVIDIGSASVTIPANVTLDLSTGGGTLRVSGGTLSVYGVIAGGAVEIASGTLLRQSGGSITAGITVSSGGVVRGPRTLSLENIDSSSGETIASITYAGISGADTSGYVTRAATGVIYARMTGSNYSSYQSIETVTTDAGNVFRLGTRYTDTLSLVYTLTYGGLTGATLTTLNPTSYTASDAAITLNNPTKDGFVFTGWTCDAIGVTVPDDSMVIPEGTTGNLTLIANWMEDMTAGGTGGRSGGSGLSGSGSGTTTDETTDAEEAQAAAAAQDNTATTQSTRRTRVASSSTRVAFTDDVNTALPTIEAEQKPSFPWGWIVGGFAALGGVIYIMVRLVERKKRSA